MWSLAPLGALDVCKQCNVAVLITSMALSNVLSRALPQVVAVSHFQALSRQKRRVAAKLERSHFQRVLSTAPREHANSLRVSHGIQFMWIESPWENITATGLRSIHCEWRTHLHAWHTQNLHPYFLWSYNGKPIRMADKESNNFEYEFNEQTMRVTWHY